ncbi:GNAT family N-acetyltransferase [Paenibacillus sp. 481]|uniref:GNAT family N-acetyltransferase n=1 Tax=Paenibacillus sp. 481 TaxID=2835869 RepID=UPI001E443E0E|nr:GNAT family N-acetyltransferase [Paenibacillus sp. 481]UHA72359.1 GNAT family N-acetyltransferase [Paenibacillus sp. 481]
MLRIDQVKDIKEAATLIFTLNNREAHHIAYCGEKEEEILNSLLNDFSDRDTKDSIVAAYEDGELIAVLGFDIDSERRTAEVWGPFVNTESGEKWLQIAQLLWTAGKELVQEHVSTAYFFFNQHHQYMAAFMDTLGVERAGENAIFHATQQLCDELKVAHLPYLDPNQHEAFIALHEEAFPNSYYSGLDILQRLNDHNKVLVSVGDNEQLQGYIYVECEPEFGEGSIEFFAVAPSFQNQGIGTRLIQNGLFELFGRQGIKKMNLCVDANDEKPIHVYKRAGLTVKHMLYFYKVQW